MLAHFLCFNTHFCCCLLDGRAGSQQMDAEMFLGPSGLSHTFKSIWIRKEKFRGWSEAQWDGICLACRHKALSLISATTNTNKTQ